MIIGTPQYRIENDRTDRIGIRTIAVSLVWRPEGDTFEQLAQVPPPPDMGGGVFLIGRQTTPEGGALKTLWLWEGIDGDGRSVTFRTRENTRDYEFQAGFSQADILQHPNLQQLIDDYQGQLLDGEIYFPPLIDMKAKGTNVRPNANAKLTKSPVAGMRDFLRMEGTYTCRYMARSLRGVMSGMGRIFTGGLPGEAPTDLEEGRNWLKAPTMYARRGPAYEIMETYWLSGPGGWSEPLYGNSSGGGNTPGRGANQGLSSGGLTSGSL